jgi:hypothetical protein
MHLATMNINKWLRVKVQVAGKEILSCEYEAFVTDVGRYLEKVLWLDRVDEMQYTCFMMWRYKSCRLDPTETRKSSVGRAVHNNDNDNNDYSYDYKLFYILFLRI